MTVFTDAPMSPSPPPKKKKFTQPLFPISPGHYSRPERNRRQWLCNFFLWRGVNKVHYGLSRNGELIIEKRHLLWNSQNREHQKYLWNVIVLQEISQ